MPGVPDSIRPYLEGRPIKEITKAHVSGDRVYQVGKEYVLKISEDPARLNRERAANDWLSGRLPVPKTVAFAREGKISYYLDTCLPGTPLVDPRFLRDPEKLARLLGEALRLFHGTDPAGCPLKNPETQGEVVIHGDFCLPNILAYRGRISGFVDTEAAGLGDPWMDYAWCLWSFQHNLGTERCNQLLLREMNVEFDPEKYAAYTAL